MYEFPADIFQKAIKIQETFFVQQQMNFMDEVNNKNQNRLLDEFYTLFAEEFRRNKFLQIFDKTSPMEHATFLTVRFMLLFANLNSQYWNLIPYLVPINSLSGERYLTNYPWLHLSIPVTSAYTVGFAYSMLIPSVNGKQKSNRNFSINA